MHLLAAATTALPQWTVRGSVSSLFEAAARRPILPQGSNRANPLMFLGELRSLNDRAWDGDQSTMVSQGLLAGLAFALILSYFISSFSANSCSA